MHRALLWLPTALVTLLTILFVAAGLLLSQGKVLGEQHAPVALDTAPDYDAIDYAGYMAWARERLAAGRVDEPNQEMLDRLAPFELVPGPQCPRDGGGKVAWGIVLIHGLIDSPWSMRPFGEDLRARCFHVLGLLLPNHGTRSGDMLDSTWRDWAAVTAFATRELAARANTVFLSGHSAGGTLSLLEAARNPAVDALILFAPALAISDAAQYARYLTPLGAVFPKAAWFDVAPDAAVYRYESLPFAAAAQTYALIEETLAQAPRTYAAPVFSVLSIQDNTIGTQAVLDYMRANSHPLSRTLLYSQHPWPATDRTTVANSSAPERGILSVSHLGLMTPPSHPWYGRDGTYRNCGHYEIGSSPYQRCKAGERDFYGEATAENLAQGVIERIAFNPWYEELLAALEGFVASVE